MCSATECTEPVHHWFGLTYCSYLILQRSVMEAMPVEWQRRLVALLEEMDETIDVSKIPHHFRVTAVNTSADGGRGRFVKDPFSDYRHPPPIPMRKPTDGTKETP